MSIEIVNKPVPLKIDIDGVIRIGGTRITLDTVIADFKEGATAEEIAYQYPSLLLSDIYSAISYYLQQQSEVEAYLHQSQQVAKEVRKQNETRFKQHGIRGRLMARRSKQN